MKKIHNLLIIICLLSISGCSAFSMARMRSVVLTQDDVVFGTIPGEPYKIINMEGEEETLTFDQDMYIVSAESMINYELKENKKFFKKMKFSKSKAAIMSGLVLLLGIALKLLQLKRKSDRGEEITAQDIVGIFKKPKKKKK